MAVLHNMELLLEQLRALTVYLSNVVQRIEGLKVWLGVGEVTSINLGPKKYLFCSKVGKNFVDIFASLGFLYVFLVIRNKVHRLCSTWLMFRGVRGRLLFFQSFLHGAARQLSPEEACQ